MGVCYQYVEDRGPTPERLNIVPGMAPLARGPLADTSQADQVDFDVCGLPAVYGYNHRLIDQVGINWVERREMFVIWKREGIVLSGPHRSEVKFAI